MSDGRPKNDESPTDVDLLRAAAEGDRNAFHVLIDRHGSDLLRLARSLSRSRSDAEDVVQETLVGAYRGLQKFDGRSSVKTWLCRILTRQAARAWNRGIRHQSTASLDAAGAEAGEPLADFRRVRSGTTLADVERRIDLHAVLQTLGEDHRTVVMLRDIQGMSYSEIAAALGVPQGTVESRLFRARAELREKLREFLK